MRKDNLGVWKALVTCFGLGFVPVAPGTMGAIGALIPGMIIIKYSSYPDIWLSVLILISIVIGIIGSNRLEPVWGKDPSRIVIDEAAGMWVSILWMPVSIWYIIPAFILFRLFDIFKPLGIRRTESLKGGTGVMADDIVAGIYANLATHALYFIGKLIR